MWGELEKVCEDGFRVLKGCELGVMWILGL